MSIPDMMVVIDTNTSKYNKAIQEAIDNTNKLVSAVSTLNGVIGNGLTIPNNVQKSNNRLPKALNPYRREVEKQSSKEDQEKSNPYRRANKQNSKEDKEKSNPYKGMFGVVNALKSIATSLVLKQDVDRAAFRSLGAASGKMLVAALALTGIVKVISGNLKGYQSLSASGAESKQFTGTLAHLLATHGSENETKTATDFLVRARDLQRGLKLGEMPISPENMYQLTGGRGQAQLSALRDAQSDQKRFQAITKLIGTGVDRAAKTDLARMLVGDDVGLINYLSADKADQQKSFTRASAQQRYSPIYNQSGESAAKAVQKVGEDSFAYSAKRAMTNNPLGLAAKTVEDLVDLIVNKIKVSNTGSSKSISMTNNITVNGANKTDTELAEIITKKLKKELEED